jgi:hypothetical protein
VVLNRRCGDISLIRPQTITAELKVANQPERHVALPRRGLRDCLSEELRRLDADDVYAEVLTKGMALVARQASTEPKATKTTPGKPVPVKAAAAVADRKPRSRTAVKASAVQAAEAPPEDDASGRDTRPVSASRPTSANGGRPTRKPRSTTAKAAAES